MTLKILSQSLSGCGSIMMKSVDTLCGIKILSVAKCVGMDRNIDTVLLFFMK
jgi:hypothetical protein